MILPMFPLGSVLFPSQFLPLHVFEPRYRELVEAAMADTGEFGVVLIERGHEVGGGDIRSMVGTVASIVEAEQFDDGRWGLATVGLRRLRVKTWLPDKPYPVAEVDDWPDEGAEADSDAYDGARNQLRATLELLVEMGVQGVDRNVELAEDPGLGSFQIAALSTLGAFDRQRILSVPGSVERLEALTQLLDDELTFLRQRHQLEGNDNDGPTGTSS